MSITNSSNNNNSNGDLESLSTFTVKWKVKRFSEYFDSDDNELRSPELLTVYANNVMHWQLRLAKNYDRDGYANFMAIYLDYLDEFPMNASVSFAMINRSGTEQTRVFQRCTKAKFDKNLRFCGIIDFVQQNLILESNMNLLVNDCVTITCDIRFQEALLCTKFNQLSLGDVKKNPTVAREVDLAAASKNGVNNKSAAAASDVILKTLSDDMEKLYESDKYTDVSFIVGEHTIRAHKNVLSARSAVFQRLFAAHDGNVAEKKRSLVAVKDLPYEVMREVVRFLYCGKVNDAARMTRDLLVASEKYAIAGLKAICERILVEKLRYENALEFLSLAKHYKATNLHAKVMDFVIGRLAEYVNAPEFRDLTVDIKDDLLDAVSKKKVPR